MASEEKVEHDCIICASVLGTNGGTLTLLCGHPFCAECICRWRQRSWRCPVCRVMDGRELTVPPPAAGGGSPGQQRRLGGAGHMSQRLRPMAEQMLAESGDNVLDVLLQLLEGIQDGTLPADLDGVAPDQATSSGRTPPGAASLDRLVLNQLVTVLQATSALIAGRGGNSGGRPGTTAAAASPNEQQQQQQARPHSGQRRQRSPASAANTPAQRHSRRSRLQGASSQTAKQAADQGPSVEAQPSTREMSTQTSDLSDDGAPSGARQSRRDRPVSAMRLDGATSISPRRTSPDARPAAPDPEADRALPSAPTPLVGELPVLPALPGDGGSDAAATESSKQSPEERGSLHTLDAPVSEAAEESAEPRRAPGETDAAAAAPERCSGVAVSGHERQAKLPESGGGSEIAVEATWQAGGKSSQQHNSSLGGKLGSNSEGPQQPFTEGVPSSQPPRSSSGGVRALAAMFEQRRSVDAPRPVPPPRSRGRSSFAFGSASGSSAPGQRDESSPLPATISPAATTVASREPSPQEQPTARPAEAGPVAAAAVSRSVEGSAQCTEARVVKVPASVFQASCGGHPEQPIAPADPFADLLAGFGAFSRGLPEQTLRSQSSPEALKEPPSTAARAAQSSESPAEDPHADGPALLHSERDAHVLLDSPPGALAASRDEQPSMRAQGIQTDDSEAAAADNPGSIAVPPPALPRLDSLGGWAGSDAAGTPDIAEAEDTLALGDSVLLGRTLASDGTGDVSAGSSCLTSPALSPRQRTGAGHSALRLPARRRTSSMTEEAHLPPAAAASRAATPRIVAPPNTAAHSLANSEANSPRIMAEPPPGLRLPLPLLDLAPGSAQAESSATAVAKTSGAGDDQQDVQQSGEPQEPIAPVTRSPRPGGSRSRAGSHSSERERLLLRAVDEVETLVDALLGRWNSMPASQQPDHLAERMEELFLEASMLEAVRNNQVPKPRAMVEDILTRVALLDGELTRYTGQPAQSVCLASPRGSGGPATAAARPQLESPRPAAGRTQPPRTAQGLATRSSSNTQRRHRRPSVPPAAAALTAVPAAPAAAAAAASEGDAATQAAEADGALERFTEFLARHQSELQPRTRQIAELALALARLSLANNPPGSDARIGMESSS